MQPKIPLAPNPSDLAELIEAAKQGRIFVLQPPLDRGLIPPPPTVIFRRLFGLQGGESRGLTALVKQGYVTRGEMHAAVSDDDDPKSDIKVVGTIICRLRKKLRPYGIEIHTVWGEGFRLAEEDRDKLLREMPADPGADAAASTPAADHKSTAA